MRPSPVAPQHAVPGGGQPFPGGILPAGLLRGLPCSTACSLLPGLAWRTSLFGPRAGQTPLRLVDPSQARPDEPVAIVEGFNVHAARTLHGADHAQVERFCRYLARPPIAQERLEHLDHGRIRYRFKRAWKDGSTAVELEPFDLLARICALIP